jgi:glycosyltransferase involved in cell wall biosynthesis
MVIERCYDYLSWPLRGYQRKLPPPVPLLRIDPDEENLLIMRYPLLWNEKLGGIKKLTKWVTPIIRAFNPDAMIVVSPFHSPWAYASYLLNIPVFYYIYDEITYTEDGKRNTKAEESEQSLIPVVSGIIAVSEPVARRRRKYRKPILIRPNGTDTTLWQSAQTDPLPVSRPRVIFHGHMGPWIDYRHFVSVAEEMPDINFVIVGKLSGEAKNLETDRPNNIHIFPFMPQRNVAGAVKHSDVAFMPFKTDSEFSKAINPLKMYEALAAGVPVVITPLPAVPRNATGIHITHTPEESKIIIRNLIQNPPRRESLYNQAQQWDWNKLNASLLDFIGEVINGE